MTDPGPSLFPNDDIRYKKLQPSNIAALKAEEKIESETDFEKGAFSNLTSEEKIANDIQKDIAATGAVKMRRGPRLFSNTYSGNITGLPEE